MELQAHMYQRQSLRPDELGRPNGLVVSGRKQPKERLHAMNGQRLRTAMVMRDGSWRESSFDDIKRNDIFALVEPDGQLLPEIAIAVTDAIPCGPPSFGSIEAIDIKRDARLFVNHLHKDLEQTMNKKLAHQENTQEVEAKISGTQFLMDMMHRKRAEANAIEKLIEALPSKLSLEADAALWDLVTRRF